MPDPSVFQSFSTYMECPTAKPLSASQVTHGFGGTKRRIQVQKAPDQGLLYLTMMFRVPLRHVVTWTETRIR